MDTNKESDKRKFPRQPIKAQQKVLAFGTQEDLNKNFVVSRNLSASGFCFRSKIPYKIGQTFLVHLDDEILSDIKANRAHVMKSGKYILSRVVWNRSSNTKEDPYYDVGCSFIPLQEGDATSVEIFTRLINLFTTENLA